MLSHSDLVDVARWLVFAAPLYVIAIAIAFGELV
jgi:hypothetical protein